MTVNTRRTCLDWLTTAALPAWSQQLVVLPDGVQPDQRWNECGEACVSMIAAAVWGARISPDALRASLRGVSGSGLTTAADLVAMASYANVAMHELTPDGQAASGVLTAFLEDQRPAIMLGNWPTPGGVLHWLLATRVDGERVYYINPWGGVHSWLLWADWRAAYAGSLVQCAAHLHVDASLWPLPW